MRELDGKPVLEYEEVIHPEDRARVLGKLDEATQTGQFDERFRITLLNGDVRWVRVHGFPVRKADGRVWRLVGTAQEITEQKQAEDQVARNLEIAEAARAEAEALRKATQALAQDLHMDFVLDALLRSLEELIPYTCARVLVPEGGPHVLALGKRIDSEPAKRGEMRKPNPLTLIASKSPFLKRILEDRKSVLICRHETGKKNGKPTDGHAQLRSWLSVPLVAYNKEILRNSLGWPQGPQPLHTGTSSACRIAGHPCGCGYSKRPPFCRGRCFYASELEKRLADLREAETALARSEGDRLVSEEKFQKVFRSSPIPFSITTVKEGRFLDVNAAF